MTQEFSLSAILRNNIKAIKPYSTARDEYTGVALVNLDANENPYSAIGGSNHNRYPDPYQSPLKEVISNIKEIPANQIFLGNGSDEAIDLLYTAFCNPGVDNAIICPPTYGMYKVSADTNDIACIEVPLTNEYELNTEKIIQSINQHTKLIWLCSPNNPTGNLLSQAAIENILQIFKGIVVIDEAYIDFAPTESWTKKLNSYKNLVVLQTFSKAWGLANIRLGMMFASPEIISIINKIKLPYNISGLVQDFALDILSKYASQKDTMVEQIIIERNKLATSILQISGVKHVWKSDANFILVKINDANKIYNYLVNQGIIVRDRSKIELCEDSLRITIGTPSENKLLLEKLSNYMQQK